MSHLKPFGPEASGRARTFQVIFGHETLAGKAFDLALLITILTSVAVVMLDSVEVVTASYGGALTALEWLFTILFTVEYALRLWSVSSPRRYALSFFGLVDLFAVLPTYVSLVLPGGEVLIVVRILRLLRVFRVLKLMQYVGEANVLSQALKASRYKITVFLLAVVCTVVMVGAVMYVLEGPEAGFSSIPVGVYWGVVTLTTVGYGDIAPLTPLGQALAALVMVLGYGIIAVPTGIVTVELANQGRAEAAAAAVAPQARWCAECERSERDPEAAFCRYCGSVLAAAP